MDGADEFDRAEDRLPPIPDDFDTRPAPPGIELIPEKNVPPLEDEVAYAAASIVKLDSNERPILYTVDGDAIACAAEVPFIVATSPGIESPRLIATTRLSEQWDKVPLHDAHLGLVGIPSQNTTATVIDVFGATVTSIVGRSERAVELALALLGSFARRRDRDVDVVVVGAVPNERFVRVNSIPEACSLVSRSTRPLVIFVEGELTMNDAFERLIIATRRHGSAGIVTTEAHPDARVVLVAGELGRASVLVRAVTPKAARAVEEKLTHGDKVATSEKSPAPVEVAILGPVEIRKTEEPLAGHPLLTELVVYLAMHPEGATTSAWETAIWPDRRMPQQTIANRLSEARRALGIAADGRPRLRKVDERHFVADVRTDWDEFSSLAEKDDAASWRRALELVRGRPFGDLQQGQWALLEGFSAEIEHAISSLALRYGGHALRCGDPDGATWAAHRGLRATPWDERLYRLLMKAADANGDRAGVEQTLRHLALVLELDGDPLRGVHPETVRLYERLLGRTEAPFTNAFA